MVKKGSEVVPEERKITLRFMAEVDGQQQVVARKEMTWLQGEQDLNEVVAQGLAESAIADEYVLDTNYTYGENDFIDGNSLRVYVVKKGSGEETTKEIVVNYYDKNNNLISSETITVDKDATEVNASQLTLPEGYELAPDASLAIENGVVTAAVVETTPEIPDETTKSVEVSYYDGEGNLINTETILVDKDADTVDPSALNIPDGYTLADGAVLTIVDGKLTVTLKAVETPVNPETPVEMADATLYISYRSSGTEKKVETLTANGEKGKIHTFKAEDVTLTAPAGYRITGTFTDTDVAYGDSATVVITISWRSSSSGGGSSSSGGGSSTVGKSAATSAGSLVSGRWILDDIGWWYSYSNNTYAKSGWYTLEWQGKTDWYYFADNGYLVSGWFEYNGNTYYLHDVHDGTFGRMYTGWNNIGGQWYYFNDNAEAGTVGALVQGAAVPAELLNQ